MDHFVTHTDTVVCCPKRYVRGLGNFVWNIVYLSDGVHAIPLFPAYYGPGFALPIESLLDSYKTQYDKVVTVVKLIGRPYI